MDYPEKHGGTQTIAIRTVIYPSLYQKFHCLAAACQDDCCHGWRIAFDKKDYLKLRRETVPPAFKARLDQTVHRDRTKQGTGTQDGLYAHFALDSTGRCPLQDEDGLCSLQKTCGHAALPFVCQSYPRRDVYTSAAKELSLSPSCEGVLNLLWDLPDGVDFIEEDLSAGERRTCSFRAGHETLMPWFETVRSLCIDALQNRAMPLSRRFLLMGVGLHKLLELDWKNPDITHWIDWFAPLCGSQAIGEDLVSIRGNLRLFVSNNIKLALRLSRDNPWAGELLRALEIDVTVANGKADVQFELPRYQELEAALGTMQETAYFFENLMVMVTWYLSAPSLRGKEELWKSYVNLCNLYSFYRFAGAAACGLEVSKERLLHIMVMVSRALLHNSRRQAMVRDELFESDSVTLGHMAVLTGA